MNILLFPFIFLLLLLSFTRSIAFIFPSRRKLVRVCITSFVRSRIVVPVPVPVRGVLPVSVKVVRTRNYGFPSDFDEPEPIFGKPQQGSKLMLSSKVKISSTDAGSLQIVIPRIGVQGSNLFELGFSASWLGIIGYATWNTVRAGAGSLGTLFLLPFWLAGVQMANKSVIDPATALQITIGVYAWSLEKTVLGLGAKKQIMEGPTWNLEEAAVYSDIVVNGKPLTCVQLRSASKAFDFGHALTTKEKEWIVFEINEWLQTNEEEIRKAVYVIRTGESNEF